MSNKLPLPIQRYRTIYIMFNELSTHPGYQVRRLDGNILMGSIDKFSDDLEYKYYGNQHCPLTREQLADIEDFLSLLESWS